MRRRIYIARPPAQGYRWVQGGPWEGEWKAYVRAWKLYLLQGNLIVLLVAAVVIAGFFWVGVALMALVVVDWFLLQDWAQRQHDKWSERIAPEGGSRSDPEAAEDGEGIGRRL
jgi:cytochrome b subunit of formate dehydrogenase